MKRAGQDALLVKSEEDRIPLYLSDLQALLTFCLAGDDAPVIPHRYIRVFYHCFFLVYSNNVTKDKDIYDNPLKYRLVVKGKIFL